MFYRLPEGLTYATVYDILGWACFLLFTSLLFGYVLCAECHMTRLKYNYIIRCTILLLKAWVFYRLPEGLTYPTVYDIQDSRLLDYLMLGWVYRV